MNRLFLRGKTANLQFLEGSPSDPHYPQADGISALKLPLVIFTKHSMLLPAMQNLLIVG